MSDEDAEEQFEQAPQSGGSVTAGLDAKQKAFVEDVLHAAHFDGATTARLEEIMKSTFQKRDFLDPPASSARETLASTTAAKMRLATITSPAGKVQLIARSGTFTVSCLEQTAVGAQAFVKRAGGKVARFITKEAALAVVNLVNLSTKNVTQRPEGQQSHLRGGRVTAAFQYKEIETLIHVLVKVLTYMAPRSVRREMEDAWIDDMFEALSMTQEFVERVLDNADGSSFAARELAEMWDLALERFCMELAKEGDAMMLQALADNKAMPAMDETGRVLGIRVPRFQFKNIRQACAEFGPLAMSKANYREPGGGGDRRDTNLNRPTGGKRASNKNDGKCHQWEADGTCRFGEKCRFTHDGQGGKGTTTRAVGQKASAADSQEDDEETSSPKGKQKAKVAKTG